MKTSLYRWISHILIFTMIMQGVICLPSERVAYADSLIVIEEGKLEEYLTDEEKRIENKITQQYIMENMLYEDGLYEFKLTEDIIVQSYIVKTTVGITTKTELVGVLPHQIDGYEIDWPAVIGKFAVGTAIIITVGVVHHLTKGVSSFFIMATPQKVAIDAFVGGAIGAALSAVIHGPQNGETVQKRAIKYAIEGSADGFMWGAISSVLKVAGQNFKRLRAFQLATGGTLKIKLDGTVLDKAGIVQGKAYYDNQKLWHFVDEIAQTTRVFDCDGKELTSLAGTSLPANTMLRLGADASYKLCYTDTAGTIYRIDDKKLPNLFYQLGDKIYRTDAKGRTIEVTFEKLGLKSTSRGRLMIVDSMKTIGGNDARATDQKGHLIADWFNGDNTMANIVPMAPKVNQGTVKGIETTWAAAIGDGKNVRGSIRICYKGSSCRPSSFTYSYDIGDGMVEKAILNR